MTHHGVTDTDVLARIDKLEGSLRMDQRRFAAAEELMTRAATLYRVSGNNIEASRVLVTLGGLYFFRGDLSRAIETTTAALKRLRGSHEPRLYLCARYNLARYLTEDGQVREAADMQEAAREEQLTLKVVREYARYLRDARTNPSLRFREAKPS